jgi:hypothetical protein
MSERAWDIHAPNVEGRNCRYCGELFYPESSVYKYCAKHRSSKYATRVHSGIGETTQLTCRVCGREFAIETKPGRAAALCDECKAETKVAGPDQIGSRSWVLATRALTGSQGALFMPVLDIARQPSSWDDEYAQIEWMFREDQETVMRDLEIHEVVYGASITEHHQHAFPTTRLLLAIENVSENKRKKEMYWAATKIRETNGLHVKTDPVEHTWAEPASTEREQWVINLMNRFGRVE